MMTLFGFHCLVRPLQRLTRNQLSALHAHSVAVENHRGVILRKGNCPTSVIGETTSFALYNRPMQMMCFLLESIFVSTTSSK